jgi:hypothetical protein
MAHHRYFEDNKLYYTSIAIAAIIVGLILFWPHTAKSENSFGSCLKEKGLIMYGSDRCEICLNQKQILGNNFTDIKYINCDSYPDICEARSIRSYPVWSINDEKYYKGLRSLPDLSELSGCPLNTK